MDVQNKAASFAAGAAASVLLAATPAFAASVKLGSDSGGLVFDPSTVTIKKGEKGAVEKAAKAVKKSEKKVNSEKAKVIS